MIQISSLQKIYKKIDNISMNKIQSLNKYFTYHKKYLLIILNLSLLIFVTLEVMIFIELSEGYSKYNLNEQAVGASGGSWADGDAGTYD